MTVTAALYRIAYELDSSFDQQLYGEMSRRDHDPRPDDEFSVNITAKQLKALTDAVADVPKLPKGYAAYIDALARARCVCPIKDTYGGKHNFGCPLRLPDDPAPTLTTCPTCNIGNPGVYVKNGVMYCPHSPKDQP